MRRMMWAAWAAVGFQAAHAENLRIDLAAGIADQQEARTGSAIQLAATWWMRPNLGLEFTLGRGAGHDGENAAPRPFDFVSEVWAERYAGLGLRHRFTSGAAGWQPFVRAGLARVQGIAQYQVQVERFNPLDPEVRETQVYELETGLRDTSAYLGFGATRTFGDLSISVQVQHLAIEFGGQRSHGRSELLVGLGWAL